MRVGRRLRRLKRLAYLGATVGTVIGVRRARGRAARAQVGPVASWPPLEVSGQPVAAVGDLLADEPASRPDAGAPADRPFPPDPDDPAGR